MTKKSIEIYEGMGFVEALIAIVVVGMASSIIMSISARTMQEVIQNEIIDTMTQLAVEGGEMAQQIANEAILQDDPTIFPVNSNETCYIPTSDGAGNYYFRNEDNDLELDNYTERSSFIEEGLIYEGGAQQYEDYFRVVCFRNNNPSQDYIVGKVVVGLVYGDGSITKGNLVSDYEYYTVITIQ